jgi:hypothetical protein
MCPASRSNASGRPKKPRSPRCHTCNRAIRVPPGWSAGSAIRKHYWAKHPEVMRPDKERGK